MTRTRRFLGGVAVGYVGQAVTLLVGIWLTAFLLARLGQEEYGLWLVATQLLGYLLLLDLGVVLLIPRDLAAARRASASSADVARRVLGESMRLVLWQTVPVALIAAAIWLGLPDDWEALRLPLALVLVVFALAFPMRTFQAALEGLQDVAFVGVANTLTWMVGTAITVALVVRGWGLTALAVGWVVSQGALVLAWWLRLRRAHPEILPDSLPSIPRATARDRLSRGLWMSVSKVAHILLRGTHLLVIGKILGPAATVPFFCTEKLVVVLGNQVSMIPQTAMPGLSELRAVESRPRIREVTAALEQAVLLLSGGVVCVILAVNGGFVEWWVGHEQFGGPWLTVALLLGMALRHYNQTAAYALFTFGRERRLALTVLADGLVTLGATIGLVAATGLLGAAIAPIIGVVLISLPNNLRAMARELGVPVRSVVGTAWPWVWRFAFVAVACAALASTWVPRGIVTLTATTLAVLGTYAAFMWPLATRGSLGPYVRPLMDAVRRRVTRRATPTSLDA